MSQLVTKTGTTIKIHLRKRLGSLSADNEKKGKKQMSSLYLSFNLKKGDKTRYEWLNLHVFTNPKTNLQKDHKNLPNVGKHLTSCHDYHLIHQTFYLLAF